MMTNMYDGNEDYYYNDDCSYQVVIVLIYMERKTMNHYLQTYNQS